MSALPVSAKIARRVSRMVSERAGDYFLRQALQRCHVGSASSILTWTTKEELAQLFQLAADCPKNALALEVGSYLGASTCYLAAGLSIKNGRLICVDTWQNETMPEGEKNTFAEFSQNVAGVRERLTLVRKRSEELVSQDVSGSLSLIFLDGDHRYEAVKKDFETVSPWLAEQGIVAFHDCLFFAGVSRLIGEALASGEWAIGGHVNNLFWIRRARFEK